MCCSSILLQGQLDLRVLLVQLAQLGSLVLLVPLDTQALLDLQVELGQQAQQAQLEPLA